jgi:hypothetical protein
MRNRVSVKSSFTCEIAVDEKDIVYLADIGQLATYALPGAISAILSGAFKSCARNDDYGYGITSLFANNLANTRIKRYVDIITNRYKIPLYIADQLYRDYANLSANILAIFHDLDLPNIEDMHLSHDISGHLVNIFKATVSVYATYTITGEILRLPHLKNTGYQFNTIIQEIS